MSQAITRKLLQQFKDDEAGDADMTAMVDDLRLGLDHLRHFAPRIAQVLELRYIRRLPQSTIATTVGIPEELTKDELRFGRAWLAQWVSSGSSARE
jgi:DNA-directed RNA polymerase specialized sigma24 family protein